MITINFFTTLRLFLNTSQLKINAVALTMKDLLYACEKQTSKPFLHKLLDPHGNLIQGAIVLVNGHHVLHLEGLQTTVKDGDVVALFPPGGGG
jgi:sulfur-carrier protein